MYGLLVSRCNAMLQHIKRALCFWLCCSFQPFAHACLHAGRLIQELQIKADEYTAPETLSAGDAAKLHHLLRSAHFTKPDGKHLSPAGEYNLRLGVIKELHPDLIATHQGA